MLARVFLLAGWALCLHGALAAEETTMKKLDFYMFAVPKVLRLSGPNTIAVELGKEDVALRIDSKAPKSNTSVEGKFTLIKDGRGSVTYRIPFENYKEKSINLLFVVKFFARDPETRTARDGEIIKVANVTLPIQEDTVLVFIETSKPIYKPGEKIKFRILPLSPDSLLPTQRTNGKTKDLQFSLIYMQSSNGMRLAQWQNVSLLEALRGLSFDLSPDAVLGTWKIVSEVRQGLTRKIKDTETFKVAKYVLPRFIVSLKLPPYLTLDMKRIQFSVCPAYSTGLPMTAKVKAQFCVKTRSRWGRRKPRPCVTISGKTDGISKCLAFNISAKPLRLMNNSFPYWNSFAFVNASVIEVGTNATVNKTGSGGKLSENLFKILNKSPKTFKLGLPFYGQVQTVNLDGTPRPNVLLTISIFDNDFWQQKWTFKKKFKSNQNGIINFQIPPFPKGASSVYISVSAEKIVTPRIRGLYQMRSPTLGINIKSTFSPSGTYMQVYPLNRLPQQSPCDSGKLTVRLQSNVPLHDKTLQVLASSRGDISSTQTFKPVKQADVVCEDSDSDELGHYTCAGKSKGIQKIRCLKGWSGTNCLTPLCPDGCVKGVCFKPGLCSCRDGWAGLICDECQARKGCVNGCCVYGNDCQCQKGYRGYLCKTPSRYRRTAPKCYKRQKVPPVKPYDPNTLEDLSLYSRTVTLEIPTRLFPSARFAIWFLHDGPNQTEFISAALTLDNLQSCLTKATPTSFAFTETTVRPGRETIATIATTGKDPKCALAIADIALDTFGLRGGVSEAQLISDLEEVVKKTKKWYRDDPYAILDRRACRTPSPRPFPPMVQRRLPRMIMPWRPAAADSSTPFREAGVFVVTNSPFVTADCSPVPIPYMARPVPMMINRKGGRAMLGSKGPVPKPGKSGAKRPRPSKEKALKARVRTFFPEAWKFELLENPAKKITLKVPDSITTWKACMYCLSSRGLGISRPTRLVVFQPFYLSMALPYSLIRGESARLPVKVFSYLKACTQITLTMQVSQELQSNGPQTVTSCLCSFKQMTAYFRVKPKVLGRVPIEVRAESRQTAACSGDTKLAIVRPVADAVRRQLLVEPEGLPEAISVGDLLCPAPGKPANASFLLKPPTDSLTVVSDSQRAYVTWCGSLLGAALENLERIVKMPYGCGEQNIMSLIPSIYVLDYFTVARISKPDVVRKAKKYIGIGYQHQLNYRLVDGSYSAFGQRDGNGSTWLTAFVLKSFVAASRYATIERSVLASALGFLRSKIRPSGCFREDGRVFSSTLKGGMGRADETSITAYVLAALVEARIADPTLANETKAAEAAALRCLRGSKGPLSALSTYAVALRTYALTKAAPIANLTRRYQDELRRRRTVEGGLVFWRAQQKQSTRYSRPWVRSTAADVETSAYALQAGLAAAPAGTKGVVPLLPTARWLIDQRNEFGGWHSTQDTAVGLGALSALANRTSSSGRGTNLSLTIRTGAGIHRANITEANKVVVSRLSAPVPTRVNVSASGSGCALVQSNLLFNVLDVGRAGAPFVLSVTASQTAGACDQAMVRICARYTGPDRRSNMAVVRARMPSGWEAPDSVVEGFNAAATVSGVQRAEIDSKRALVLYFHGFSKTRECVGFFIQRKVEVADVRPLMVQIYDYYSPERVQEQVVSVYSDACKAAVTSNDGARAQKGSCPKCVGSKSSTLEAVKRLCAKVHYYAGVERQTEKDEAWQVTQRVGDMILVWQAKVRVPTGCKCRLGRRAVVAVESEWWRLAMDEDIRLDQRWTVLNTDWLSPKGRAALVKSCTKDSEAFRFVYRRLDELRQKEKKMKEKAKKEKNDKKDKEEEETEKDGDKKEKEDKKEKDGDQKKKKEEERKEKEEKDEKKEKDEEEEKEGEEEED